jgi:hypothetical protein
MSDMTAIRTLPAPSWTQLGWATSYQAGAWTNPAARPTLYQGMITIPARWSQPRRETVDALPAYVGKAEEEG